MSPQSLQANFNEHTTAKKSELIYNGIPLEKWPVPNTPVGATLSFWELSMKRKGTHEAIQAALLSKEDIVIAGTTYESDEYFRQKIEPFVDGKQVKFIGPVDLKQKQQLLGRREGSLNADSVGRSLSNSCHRVSRLRNSSHRLESLVHAGNHRKRQVRLSRLLDRRNGRENKGIERN